MAAPTEVNIHGVADALNDLQDEPAVNSVLDVLSVKSKFTRERRDRKNHHGNVRRIDYFNPMLAIAISAYAIGITGLATQHPGTRVTSLANFAAEQRGMDPAVGSMIMEDAEDEWTLEDDKKTSINIIHAPFVTPAD